MAKPHLIRSQIKRVGSSHFSNGLEIIAATSNERVDGTQDSAEVYIANSIFGGGVNTQGGRCSFLLFRLKLVWCLVDVDLAYINGPWAIARANS